jgi:hypothetical protein
LNGGENVENVTSRLASSTFSSVKSSGGVGLFGTAATSKGELKIEDGEWYGTAGAAV